MPKKTSSSTTKKPARKSARMPAAVRVGVAASPRENLQHFNIRTARDNLPKLVSDVEGQTMAYTLGRREDPSVLMVGYDQFEALFRTDFKARLAFLVVWNLLEGAPEHLRKPQFEELLSLPKEDLFTLLDIERLPLAPRRLQEIESNLSDSRILQRLLKRARIAKAIQDAEREGLYEVLENQSSQVDLGEDDEESEARELVGEAS